MKRAKTSCWCHTDQCASVPIMHQWQKPTEASENQQSSQVGALIPVWFFGHSKYIVERLNLYAVLLYVYTATKVLAVRLLSDQTQSVCLLFFFCVATLKSSRLHPSCVVLSLSAAVSSLQLRRCLGTRGMTSVLPHCRCVVFVCRVKLTVFTAASAAGEAAGRRTNLRFSLLLPFRQPQLPPLSLKNNRLLKQNII